MSDSEVSKAQDFQSRMFEKIRDSIGDLITDEELGEIVRKALDKSFFEPTWVGSGYHRRQDGPSWTEQKVTELLRPAVQQAIEQYVAAHTDEVRQSIDQAIKEGMGVALLQAVNGLFAQDLYSFQSNIQGHLERLRTGG